MKLSPSQRKSLEEAANTYHAALTVDAINYLRGRGLNKETATTALLGSVTEPLPGDEDYRGMLAIPYITTGGVVDMRFRQMPGSEGPKYLSRHGSRSRLYNVRAFLSDHPVIAVCEGEIDALTLTQCGLPAIGIPGANTWGKEQKHWARMFDDYDRVLVVCDGDQAGVDFGKRVADRLDQAVIVHLPDGEDSNSYMMAHGASALLEKVGS